MVEWCSEDASPIEIGTSYSFKCMLTQSAQSDKLKKATIIADNLNDLIEEYHISGTPRRERRMLRFEFDKRLRILQKYCDENNIRLTFIKTD